MSKWSDVKLGSLITCFDSRDSEHIDNLIVVSIAHDWAVLRQREGSEVVSTVLEPHDVFEIGEFRERKDGSYTLFLT